MGNIFKVGQFFKTVLLSLISWNLIIVLGPVCIVYRSLINQILKVKFRTRYGGLLDKEDSLFLRPNGSMTCAITCVAIAKSKEKMDNIFNDIRQIIKEKIFDHPHDYAKLTCTKHNFGGYAYLLNNNCTINDVLNLIEVPKNTPFDEEYLKDLSGKINSSRLPKNESVLWSFYVSKIPLEDQTDDNHYRYPIIMRFHHAIGDGTSLVALFLRLFGDPSAQNYNEELFKKLFREKPLPVQLKNQFKIIRYHLNKLFHILKIWFNMIFIAFGRLVESNQLKPMNVNALHDPNLSGEKIVVWAAEKNKECVSIVKKIKDHVPNTKFTPVVCTAVSASFTNFFKRNSFTVPEFTSGVITILLGFPIVDPYKPVPLKNKTTAGVFDLPTTKRSKSLLETLKAVTKNIDEQVSFENALIGRFAFGYVLGYIPINLFTDTLGFDSHTFLITNVPGGSETKILNGCVLEKILPIAPNLGNIGLSIALLTYDDRFQIGLLADKAVLDSKAEAQRIVDDILENIRQLDDEFQKLYVNK